MNFKETTVVVDTGKDFIKIASDYSESYFKRNINFFSPIIPYNFYYEGSTSINPNSEKFWDSNVIKACAYMFLYAFDEFAQEYSDALEEHKGTVWNNYLNPLKTKITLEEAKSDLNDYIAFGSLGKGPSDAFVAGLGYNTLMNRLNGLVYRILLYSLYNMSKPNTPFFDFKITEKTFNCFDAFKGAQPATSGDIFNNLDAYATELYNKIEACFTAIAKNNREYHVIDLSINNSNYPIRIIKGEESKFNEEVNFLNKIKASYEEAKADYEEALKDKTAEKIKKIEEDLFSNYFVSSTVRENEPAPYKFFASKWVYYMIYETQSIPGASFTFRDRELIIHNLDKITKNGGLTTELKEAIRGADSQTLNDNIIREMFRLAIENGPLGSIRKDILEELKTIEESRQEVDSYYEPISLKNVNSEFAKKIFTLEERALFDAISKYWDTAYEKYKKYLSSGTENEKAEYLKNIILGITKKGSTTALKSLKEDIEGLTPEKINSVNLENEVDIYLSNLTRTWELTLKNIEYRFMIFEDLRDIRSYNIVDLYSYFSFYFYERRKEPTSETGGGSATYYIPFTIYASDYFPKRLSFASYKDTSLLTERTVFRDELQKELERVLNEIPIIADKKIGAETVLREEAKRARVYEEREESILQNKVEVKDFFYVDGEYLPTGKTVDVLFQVYDSKFDESEFISVSRRIEEIEVKENGLYEDNYFVSMEIQDLGGTKEINLVLKSPEETNLENIIYNSMIGPVGRYNKGGEKSNDINELYNLIKQKDINFKVRFGYSDIYEEGKFLESETILGSDFRERVEKQLPVRTSPWLYFTITELNTRTIENEMIYEIKGVTLGEDILNNFSVFSADRSNFLRNSISPMKGLAYFAQLMYKASNGKICIMGGDRENLVITDFDEDKNTLEKKTISFEGNSNAKIKSSFENLPNLWNFGNTSNANFGISDLTKENKLDLKKNKNKEISIREMLNEVAEWLPKKFYLSYTDEGVQYVEEYNYFQHSKIRKSNKQFSIVSLSATYEIIETKAKFLDDHEFTDKILVRFYYKGPKLEEKTQKVRYYTFKHTQDTVVKSLSIENEVDIGNVKSYCSIVASGVDSVFSSKFLLQEENKWPTKDDIKEVSDIKNKVVLIPKKNSLIYKQEVPKAENVSADQREEAEENLKVYLSGLASNHLNNMEMWPFEGELEILGDPYYLFDDQLSLGKHMIYLDVNRINRLATNDVYMVRSYYTGVYIITGIEHSINSDGDFTTRLKILKDITK